MFQDVKIKLSLEAKRKRAAMLQQINTAHDQLRVGSRREGKKEATLALVGFMFVVFTYVFGGVQESWSGSNILLKQEAHAVNIFKMVYKKTPNLLE